MILPFPQVDANQKGILPVVERVSDLPVFHRQSRHARKLLAIDRGRDRGQGIDHCQDRLMFAAGLDGISG